MSRRNASQLTVSLGSCEWKLPFWGDIYDPIQRLTSQTQEGRNLKVPYSIKRSIKTPASFPEKKEEQNKQIKFMTK